MAWPCQTQSYPTTWHRPARSLPMLFRHMYKFLISCCYKTRCFCSGFESMDCLRLFWCWWITEIINIDSLNTIYIITRGHIHFSNTLQTLFDNNLVKFRSRTEYDISFMSFKTFQATLWIKADLTSTWTKGTTRLENINLSDIFTTRKMFYAIRENQRYNKQMWCSQKGFATIFSTLLTVWHFFVLICVSFVIIIIIYNIFITMIIIIITIIFMMLKML